MGKTAVLTDPGSKRRACKNPKSSYDGGGHFKALSLTLMMSFLLLELNLVEEIRHSQASFSSAIEAKLVKRMNK